MTTTSTLSRLPLNVEHVMRQFNRRGDLNEAQFLYGEVARRMDERLRLVRLEPTKLLDAGCGAGAQIPLLHARYPNAHFIGQDHNAGLLALAQAVGLPGHSLAPPARGQGRHPGPVVHPAA